MSILVDQKTTGFLHRNQMFDVIIEKSDYDIENRIMMQKAWSFGSSYRLWPNYQQLTDCFETSFLCK